MALRSEKIEGVSGKGPLIELEFGMLVFIWREENWRTRRKTRGRRREPKTNSKHIRHWAVIEPWTTSARQALSQLVNPAPRVITANLVLNGS